MAGDMVLALKKSHFPKQGARGAYNDSWCLGPHESPAYNTGCSRQVLSAHRVSICAFVLWVLYKVNKTDLHKALCPQRNNLKGLTSLQASLSKMLHWQMSPLSPRFPLFQSDSEKCLQLSQEWEWLSKQTQKQQGDRTKKHGRDYPGFNTSSRGHNSGEPL